VVNWGEHIGQRFGGARTTPGSLLLPQTTKAAIRYEHARKLFGLKPARPQFHEPACTASERVL
jgi:hypothetical protein